MARIKKKGLEYFPLDTDFMHHRVVRRIMKREGDRALAVLVTIFSYIYSDEGYFLRLDGQCLDDIAAYFYDLTVDDIKRIVEAAVEGGLFDEGLYEREHVLTSAHIQQQYVFIKKKSKDKALLPDLCLLPTDEENGKGGEKDGEKEDKAENRDGKTVISPEIEPQRKEKHSTAKHRKSPSSVPAGRRRGKGDSRRGGRQGLRRQGTTDMDTDRHRRAAPSGRREEAQLRRTEGQPAPLPHPARRTVCHHPAERLRGHRAQRLAGLLHAARQRRENQVAGEIFAEPEVRTGGNFSVILENFC